MDYQKKINQLYQDFNNRNIDAVLAHLNTKVTWPNGWEGGHVQGHEEVRAYWLRQWNVVDPNVLPVSFQVRPDGEIAVGVHQVIKDLNGQVLSDSQIIHTYTFDEEKVIKMVIENK